MERADEENRQTSLCEKLQQAIPQIEQVTTDGPEGEEELFSYEEILMRVDPMIGMENVTPYDFMLDDRN